MLVNYLVTALRAFERQRLHFVLNVAGFAIGMAAAILMALFAYQELSVDRTQPDAERTYRVYADNTARGLSKDGAIDPRIPLLMAEHSQIESLMLLAQTDFLQYSGQPLADLVRVEDRRFKLRRFYVATANLRDFVDIDVVAGDLERALQQPGLLAISAREAVRLFGRTDVVGETLPHDNGRYQVSAVFADLPDNTHFAFDVLTSVPKVERGPFGSHVYLKLRPGADAGALAKLMTDELHRLEPRRHQTRLDLIPLTRVHFNSNGEFDMKQGGSYLALQVSVLLSLLLVIIAGVNFVNFSIAGAARRAKEIGVRKTLGARRGQLISQFLMESLLVALVAGALAMLLVELSLPGLNQLLDRQLLLDYGSGFMAAVIVAILVIGLISGLYPALFMSSFSAKRVLSGDLSRGRVAVWVRKLTLCFQGAFAVGLIIAVITLYRQMAMVEQLPVGYAKTNRLVVHQLPAAALYQKEGNALLTALAQIDGVQQVGISDTNYTSAAAMGLNFTWPNGEVLEGFQPNIVTGYHAAEALGLELLAGRDFSPQFAGDWYSGEQQGPRTAGVLVTRQMALMAGYTDVNDAVGQTLTSSRYNLTATVVGVVDNIRLGSVTKPELPTSVILGFSRSDSANLVLKTNSHDRQRLVSEVQQVLSEQLSRSDVALSWIEQDVAAAHRSEAMTLTMLGLLSPLAILLTCLGTFGLASYATLQRQKEVAVRKVLGASRMGIVNLLAREFLWLVGISVVLAYPLSYLLLSDWLANFNQRIDQSLVVYLLAACAVAGVTWLTVASLAFNAASTRPSLILRYE